MNRRAVVGFVCMALTVAIAGVSAQGGSLVTGSSMIPVFDGEQHWQYSAVKHKDGSFSGELQLFTSQTNGGRIHGNIVCFASDASTGNARLAVQIESSTSILAPEGSYAIWSVKDNGPGNSDQTSDLFPVSAAQAAFHCSNGFALGMVANQRGQIKVHK